MTTEALLPEIEDDIVDVVHHVLLQEDCRITDEFRTRIRVLAHRKAVEIGNRIENVVTTDIEALKQSLDRSLGDALFVRADLKEMPQ